MRFVPPFFLNPQHLPQPKLFIFSDYLPDIFYMDFSNIYALRRVKRICMEECPMPLAWYLKGEK